LELTPLLDKYEEILLSHFFAVQVKSEELRTYVNYDYGFSLTIEKQTVDGVRYLILTIFEL